MKKFTFLLAALMIPFFMTGQDELPYRLFETMYMTPKAGSSSALKDALGAHNRKYHPRGTYQSQVYYVMNGPNAGKLVWSMGPTTWTQHENRPDDQGHTDDWDKNVSTLVDEMGGTDYWKLDAENSNFGGPFDLNKLQVWMVDLKSGQDYRASSVFKKVVAAMKSMDDPLPFGVYDRQLAGTHGYDLVMIWFFDSLEWYDDDSGAFRTAYEETHGEGSYQMLVDEWRDIVDRLDVEVWQFMPEMSGHDGKAIVRE